ncbi:hypothetical protein [Chryseobacterium sp. Leaf394]|uniref:hypothetical protein n=1 Tax=Chryseobacterium sp. Leaf394 TaxID=1736361 RepID=UPI000FF88753|nr:hypothetical protein [Chryseobacterium sp. Leaf394]
MIFKFLTPIFILFFATYSSAQSEKLDYKNLLIGKWEYNIAYDTIAVVDDGKNRSENFFFTDMKISKDKIKISDYNEKLDGHWELKNYNQLFIYLKNKKVLKYSITTLDNENIELQIFGFPIPTLGFKRK